MVDNAEIAVFKESPLKTEGICSSMSVLLNSLRENPAIIGTSYHSYYKEDSVSQILSLTSKPLDIRRMLFLPDGILVDSDLSEYYLKSLESKTPYVGKIQAFFHNQPNFFLEITYSSVEDRGYPKGEELLYQRS
ncbi:MAG: hypothetical protein PHQ59_04895 [Candidatus Daviesbacteria bacterium]|nr:hypothetical protein [Candidatus Daviesbacteria bacterium]